MDHHLFDSNYPKHCFMFNTIASEQHRTVRLVALGIGDVGTPHTKLRLLAARLLCSPFKLRVKEDMDHTNEYLQYSILLFRALWLFVLMFNR